MVLRCAWGTCNVDERYPERLRNGVRLILFPKPKTNLEKCLRWIKACGRPHDQLNVQRINKHKAVCSKVIYQFTCKMQRKRLKKNMLVNTSEYGTYINMSSIYCTVGISCMYIIYMRACFGHVMIIKVKTRIIYTYTHTLKLLIFEFQYQTVDQSITLSTLAFRWK